MENRTIVLVGATGKIGSNLASCLDSKGFSLVLVGRSLEKLNKLADSFSSNRHTVEVIDFQDGLEFIEPKISAIAKKNSNVTSLIFASGTLQVIPFMQTTPKLWTESMNTNLFAAVECIKGFVRGSAADTPNKSIVLMSSVASTGGQLGLSTYSSSKAALESVAKSAARELSRRKIRVNTVQFGLIPEGLGEEIQARVGQENFKRLIDEYPLGQATASEASKAAMFLISDQASWITGSNMVVDGGFSTR